MIAAPLTRRFLPHLAKTALSRQGAIIGTQALNLKAFSVPTIKKYTRQFSTIDPSAVVVEPSMVTKKVRVLNIDVVKNILNELNSVDTNHDGR